MSTVNAVSISNVNADVLKSVIFPNLNGQELAVLKRTQKSWRDLINSSPILRSRVAEYQQSERERLLKITSIFEARTFPTWGRCNGEEFY